MKKGFQWMEERKEYGGNLLAVPGIREVGRFTWGEPAREPPLLGEAATPRPPGDLDRALGIIG